MNEEKQIEVESTDLFGVEKAIRSIKHAQQSLDLDYRNKKQKLESKMTWLTSQKEMLMADIDVVKINNAKLFISTSGVRKNFYGDARGVLQQAIDDVLDDFKILRSNYFYTKNYDRWSGQGGYCPYGMCPSHGSVVFEIRMNRILDKHAIVPTEAINAILYFLNLLKDEKTRKVVLLENE